MVIVMAICFQFSAAWIGYHKDKFVYDPNADFDFAPVMTCPFRWDTLDDLWPYSASKIKEFFVNPPKPGGIRHSDIEGADHVDWTMTFRVENNFPVFLNFAEEVELGANGKNNTRYRWISSGAVVVVPPGAQYEGDPALDCVANWDWPHPPPSA